MKKSKKSRAKPVVKPPAVAESVLVLRLCRADMTSKDGFRWPESGPVSAPDWKPTAECGNGLHGWLWGEGDHGSCGYFDGGKWLVVRVSAADCIDLKGKVKFPRGEVVHCGDQATATAYLRANGADGRKVIGGTASAGSLGTASAGDLGTASAGYLGTASAGYLGTASAGDLGTASAGDRGTASAGDRGTASAGYLGTASAGYLGTASAGYRGTASAGDRGTASAGEDGALICRWWDGTRWRLAVGYVGEAGIAKGKFYHVEAGKLIEGEHPDAKSAREEAAAISKKKPADR